ncbi:MAG: ATP-binding protein [Bacteroidales bacterium]
MKNSLKHNYLNWILVGQRFQHLIVFIIVFSLLTLSAKGHNDIEVNSKYFSLRNCVHIKDSVLNINFHQKLQKLIFNDTIYGKKLEQAFIEGDSTEVLTNMLLSGIYMANYQNVSETSKILDLITKVWKEIGKKDTAFLNVTQFNLANCYFFLGLHEKALNQLKLCENYFKNKKSKKRWLGEIYCNMGYLYLKQKDYINALNHLEKAPKHFQPNYYSSIISCYTDIAYVYLGLEEPEKAALYADSAKTYIKLLNFEKNNDIRIIEKKKRILFHYYLLKTKQFFNTDIETAKEFLKTAEHYLPDFFKNYHILSLYNTHTNILIKEKKYTAAEKILKKSINIATNNLFYFEVIQFKKQLSDLYQLQHKFKQSLQCMQELTILQDSIARSESTLNNRIKLQYETTQNKRKIKLLTQSNTEQQKALYWQKFTILILIGFAAGILISLIYLLKNHRQTREKNHLLKKKNNIIKKQKEELLEINEGRNKIISILSHDFRSPINNIVSLIDLVNNGYIDKNSEEFDDFLFRIKYTSLQYQKLLETTLIWAKTQNKAFKVEEKEINLEVFALGIKDGISNLGINKNIEITFSVEENIICKCDPNITTVILHNLVNNAIKFSEKNSKIEVLIYSKDQHKIIAVKDSGIGIPKDMQDHIFDLKVNTHRSGTNEETGSGYGLSICKDLASSMKADLYFESIEEKGSTFFLSLPSTKC